MGWIDAGATSLLERTRDITVLHEVTESGNAIVYSLAGAQVTANDGSTVVVARTGLLSNLLEVLLPATLLVEQPRPASTLKELS